MQILAALLWRAVSGPAKNEKWPVDGGEAAFVVRMAIIASITEKIPPILEASIENFEQFKNNNEALGPELDKFVEYLCRFTYLHNSTKKISWLESDWKTNHIVDVCSPWTEGYVRRGILNFGEQQWEAIDQNVKAMLEKAIPYISICLAAARVYR